MQSDDGNYEDNDYVDYNNDNYQDNNDVAVWKIMGVQAVIIPFSQTTINLTVYSAIFLRGFHFSLALSRLTYRSRAYEHV